MMTACSYLLIVTIYYILSECFNMSLFTMVGRIKAPCPRLYFMHERELLCLGTAIGVSYLGNKSLGNKFLFSVLWITTHPICMTLNIPRDWILAIVLITLETLPELEIWECFDALFFGTSSLPSVILLSIYYFTKYLRIYWNPINSFETIFDAFSRKEFGSNLTLLTPANMLFNCPSNHASVLDSSQNELKGSFSN